MRTEGGDRALPTARSGALRVEPASPSQAEPPATNAEKVCPSCGSPSKFEGRCGACIAADYDDYDDYIDDGCYECGGEGFVSDCVEAWACVDPDYGCDYCTRPCPLCNPRKPDPALQAVLAEALAQAGTHPKGGDSLEAPALLSDAAAEGHAPNPNPHRHTTTPADTTS